MSEIQALQNAVNSCAALTGMRVNEKMQNDRRRTVKYYFLSLNGTSVSPSLDYENMNHFIHGILTATKIL